MALRDQPYLPLYIKDFTTDEKLMECSAQATGVYIRIMCVMHKSEPYGTILLRQKDKQNKDQIKNFAAKLAKFLPFGMDVILDSLNELISEKCLCIDGDFLYQKRMKRDGELSITRSNSGSLGGKKTKEKFESFALPKKAANSVIANGIINNSLTGLNWGKESTDFLKDKIWIEQFCMQKGLKKIELERAMKQFITTMTLQEDWKTCVELKRHFTNYFNKFGLNGATKSTPDEKELQANAIKPEQYFTES